MFIADTGCRLFVQAGWLSSTSSGSWIYESLLFAVSPGSSVFRLNRIVIIRPKQACSTRDEIEATASLEFIALYVERSRAEHGS